MNVNLNLVSSWHTNILLLKTEILNKFLPEMTQQLLLRQTLLSMKGPVLYFQIPAHLQKMLPFSALQAANHQAALAAAACLPQQLAQMQAAAAAQHYNSLSVSQVNMNPSNVTSLAGQHGVTATGMPTYTGGHMYATPTMTQAQALSALSHHHQVNGLVSTVPTMALSPSMGGVTLAHPASSMQKLLSLPPPKVRNPHLLTQKIKKY